MKTKLYLIAFLVALITVFSCLSAGSDARSTFGGVIVRKLPVYSVDRSDKKIAITFDCAWGVEHTDEIIDAANRYGVKCTFFAVQFWTERYPEYIKKLDENGIEIGTHSKTHPHMSTLSEKEIREELSSSAAAIEKITGKKVTLFRAPFGDYNDALITVAEDMGLKTIQWDVDSLDWKDLSAAEIAARIVKRVKSGSIILCHNNGKNTAAALPIVFSDLKDKGYEFVTVSELLLSGDTTIDNNGMQKYVKK